MLKRSGGIQSGQALAEYQVLFPGVIVLVLGILFTLGGGITEALGDVVDGLTDTLAGGGEGTPVCVEWITTQGSSYCDQHALCDLLEQGDGTCTEGFNDCQVLYAEAPSLVVIKAGRDYQFYLDPNSYRYMGDEPSCFDVTYFNDPNSVDGVILSWQPNPEASGCKDASNVQVWAPDSVLTECAEYSE